MEAEEFAFHRFSKAKAGGFPCPLPRPAGAARGRWPAAPELAEKLISPKYRPTGLCSARCQVTGTGGPPVTRLLREWEGREGAGGPGPPGRRLASAGPSLVDRSCALHGGDPRRFLASQLRPLSGGGPWTAVPACGTPGHPCSRRRPQKRLGHFSGAGHSHRPRPLAPLCRKIGQFDPSTAGAGFQSEQWSSFTD